MKTKTAQAVSRFKQAERFGQPISFGRNSKHWTVERAFEEHDSVIIFIQGKRRRTSEEVRRTIYIPSGHISGVVEKDDRTLVNLSGKTRKTIVIWTPQRSESFAFSA